MNYAKDYIIKLLSRGKYCFSKVEALSELNITELQFKKQVGGLIKKKMLRRLMRDFFMIIPAEHLILGSLPPHWIIDPLMKHLNQPYYVGLLSAASFYGATNQQPMTFQVITNKATRPIKLPRGAIEFHVFKESESAQTTNLKTPTGYATISTKEQTIVDLVRFYQPSGYFDNVVAIIRVLIEDCEEKIFTKIISNEKTKPVLQRLGYILSSIQQNKFADIIEQKLMKEGFAYSRLRPDMPKSIVKSTRWKLIINDEIDIS